MKYIGEHDGGSSRVETASGFTNEGSRVPPIPEKRKQGRSKSPRSQKRRKKGKEKKEEKQGKMTKIQAKEGWTDADLCNRNFSKEIF